MKKLHLILVCALTAMLFCSCQKVSYKSFVGTWGVEKIDYKSYNTDYAGNPIQASMIESHFVFDPNDTNDGIHLIFRADKTGEMRDSAVDTVWFDWNPETQEYDSYIVNPDTVLVRNFTYSFDDDESLLYMNLLDDARTYKMFISNFTSNGFVYENTYDRDDDNRVYIEIATMKRVSDAKRENNERKAARPHPHMHNSFLSGR